MREIFIGEYIRQRRNELGLLQKELCDGICESATLSRLENGKQTPSRNVINALLQRLGLPSDRYFALLGKQEARLESLMEEITDLHVSYLHCVGAEKADLQHKALIKLNELEQLAETEDKLTQQFISRIKVLLGKPNGEAYSYEEQMTMLLDALRLTVPQFDLNNINGSLYCLDEIKIINQIAGIYTKSGRHRAAAEILEQLLAYMQAHHLDILYTRGHLPMVAYNYARVLNLCGENEKAWEIAELAHEACIKYNNYQTLPRIIHTKALICHDTGKDPESKKLYHQAHTLCQVLHDQINLEALRADAREQYGIEFEH